MLKIILCTIYNIKMVNHLTKLKGVKGNGYYDTTRI